MKIAAKEARETLFWLLLCKYTKGYPNPETLLDKLTEIRRLLSSILYSAKSRPPLIRILFFLFKI